MAKGVRDFISTRIVKIKRGYYVQIIEVPSEKRTVINLFGPKNKLIETELRHIDDLFDDSEIKQEKLKIIKDSEVIKNFLDELIKTADLEDLGYENE